MPHFEHLLYSLWTFILKSLHYFWHLWHLSCLWHLWGLGCLEDLVYNLVRQGHAHLNCLSKHIPTNPRYAGWPGVCVGPLSIPYRGMTNVRSRVVLNSGAVCSVQCEVRSLQCEVYSVQCAVCDVQFAACSVQRAAWSAVCNMLYSSDKLSFAETQISRCDFQKSVNEIPDNNWKVKWHLELNGNPLLCSIVSKCSQQCSVQCSAVQCSAVQCSAVQCSAVQCTALHYTAVFVLHCCTVQ